MKYFFCVILLFVVYGCSTDTYYNQTSQFLSAEGIISSGGELQGKIQCPTAANDVIVDLESLNLAPEEGEPELSMKGLWQFIQDNNISTISQLVQKLPDHYKTNFSLVEHTRGEGQSNLKYPRIVFFGTDGHFLMNISTKPDDPKHDLLDCGYMDEKTGKWEFSQFDFTGSQPKLHVSPQSCVRCHGKEPRPFWGTNMDWPGVFGDNEATGPNGEALSFRHAKRMNEIRKGNSYSDRLDGLIWKDAKLTSGGIRRIADHAFGAELLVSNLVMGSATARGAFIRIKNKYPKRFKELREAMLLLGYEQMVSGLLSDQEKETLRTTIKRYGGEGANIDQALKVLGLDTEETFSLSTLALEEEPQTDWSLGAGNLYELLYLQILDDLARDDPKVASILGSVSNEPGIFGCEGLAKNMKEVLDFKMLHLFYLTGKSRYLVNKVFYPQDVENIKVKLFIPLYDELGSYLRAKI